MYRGPPGDLVGQVDAGARRAGDAARRRLGGDGGVGRHVEVDVGGQLAVRRGAGRPAPASRPSATVTSPGRRPSARGRGRDEQRPHVARRRRATPAPESAIDMLPAVRPSSGPWPVCAGSIRTPVQGDVELVGGELGERGEDALPELDLADPHVDRAVGADRAASGTAAGWRGRSPAAGVRRRSRSRHARPARSTARDHPALGAAPAQVAVQRLRRTSASSGAGRARSRAAALTTIPEMQYPHWAACSSSTACCTGCRRAVGARPSTVTTVRPAADHSGVSQEGTTRAVEQHEAGAAQAQPAAEPGAHAARARRAARRAAGCRGSASTSTGARR